MTARNSGFTRASDTEPLRTKCPEGTPLPWHWSAAAGLPRTHMEYGFGGRAPAIATSRPPSSQRLSPTLGSNPAAQRSATTPRRAAQRNSSSPTATLPSTPQPAPPHDRTSPTRGLFFRFPLLCNYHLDYPNPLSSLSMTSISGPASSTTPTPTGRASNAPDASATPPSRSLPWVHLCHHRTTSWTTSPGPVAHFMPRSKPSPQRSATHYRRQHRSSRPLTTHGLNACLHCSTPAPCPTRPRIRSNVDAPLDPTQLPCHHLLPLGRFSDTCYDCEFLVVDRHGHLHPLVAAPPPQVPGAQAFVPKYWLAYPFIAVTKRPRHARPRGLLRPSVLDASGQRIHPPLY